LIKTSRKDKNWKYEKLKRISKDDGNMWKYLILFPIIMSTVIVFLSQVGNTYAQVNEMSQTYENRKIGLKLSYPSDWVKNDGSTPSAPNCDKAESLPCVLPFAAPDTTHPFGFTLLAVPKEKCECNSLMEFVGHIYDGSQQANEAFSFINDNQTTVGKKYPSWQYEFSYLLNNDNAKAVNVLTTNNETYFSIQIKYPTESQAKRLPQFKKVMDSIEFLPIQVSKTPSFMNMSESEQLKPSVVWENTANRLQILSHNSFTDSVGYMHVVGEIKNNSPSTATFVKITGTFYDANNQVVGTSFAYSDPSDLLSGQTSPFEILLLSASIPISQIDHYNLQASSQ
jgi:hypothetical protein